MKLSCTTSTSDLTECRKRRQLGRRGLLYDESNEEDGSHFLSAANKYFTLKQIDIWNLMFSYHFFYWQQEEWNERTIENNNPIVTTEQNTKEEELSSSILWSSDEFLRNDNKLAPGLHGVLASNKRVFLVFTVATYTTGTCYFRIQIYFLSSRLSKILESYKIN